jgi:hypothetical protein
LFDIYANVSGWKDWDPDTKEACIDGPFEVGSKGHLTPAKGRRVPMVLTEVVPGRRFTVESKIPLLCMKFEHELHPRGQETEVIHRVAFSGLLSTLLGRIIGSQVDKGLPVTLANLKALAEASDA